MQGASPPQTPSSEVIKGRSHRGAASFARHGDAPCTRTYRSRSANALRRHERTGALTAAHALAAVNTWRRYHVARHRVTFLLGRIWELRANLTPYDSAYVALAEVLECHLMTYDQALASSPFAKGVTRLLTS